MNGSGEDDRHDEWQAPPRFQRVLVQWETIKASQKAGMNASSALSGKDSGFPAICSHEVEGEQYMEILLHDWMQNYVKEKDAFVSVSLFCDVKLKELLELTQRTPEPNRVRTAVCLDLLQSIIAAIQGPHLRALMERLKDDIIRSIYTTNLFQNDPPTLSDFLGQTEWFTVLNDKKEKNRVLEEKVKALLAPSKLNAIRALQQKVIKNMTWRWQNTVTTWVFWEWRNWTTRQKIRRNNKNRQQQVIGTFMKLSNKNNRWLLQKVFSHWRLHANKTTRKVLNDKIETVKYTTKHVERESTQMKKEIAKLEVDLHSMEAQLEKAKEKLASEEDKYEQALAGLGDLDRRQNSCKAVMTHVRPALVELTKILAAQTEVKELESFNTFQTVLPESIFEQLHQHSKEKVDFTKKGASTHLVEFARKSKGEHVKHHASLLCLQWASRQMELYLEKCSENNTIPDVDCAPFNDLEDFCEGIQRRRFITALKYGINLTNKKNNSQQPTIPSLYLLVGLRDNEPKETILAVLVNLVLDDAHIYASLRIPIRDRAKSVFVEELKNLGALVERMQNDPDQFEAQVAELEKGQEAFEKIVLGGKREHVATKHLQEMHFYHNVSELNNIIQTTANSHSSLADQISLTSGQEFRPDPQVLSDILGDHEPDSEEVLAIKEVFQDNNEAMCEVFLQYSNQLFMPENCFKRFVKALHIGISGDMADNVWDRVVQQTSSVGQGIETISFQRWRQSLIRLAIFENPSDSSICENLRNLFKSRVFASIKNAGPNESYQLTYLQRLMSPGLEEVLDRNKRVLRQVFHYYAKNTQEFLSFQTLLRFLKDFGMLNHVITQYDVKEIFKQVEFTDPDGLIITPSSDDNSSDDLTGRRLSFSQFNECLVGVSHYAIRNPYYALHDRVDKFIELFIRTKLSIIKRTN